MKNEQKIVELLTHVVRKVDQNDELIQRMDERIEQNKERIEQGKERLDNLGEISLDVLTLLRDLAKRPNCGIALNGWKNTPACNKKNSMI